MRADSSVLKILKDGVYNQRQCYRDNMYLELLLLSPLIPGQHCSDAILMRAQYEHFLSGI